MPELPHPLPLLSCACHGRRAWLQTLVAGAAVAGAGTAWAQVDVGKSSALRKLVPAETLEQAAQEQYAQLLAQAKQQGALAGPGNAQLQRLQTIAGTVPELVDLPAGCTFAGRCSFTQPACQTQVPPAIALAADNLHHVHCLRPEAYAATAPAPTTRTEESAA